MITRRAAIIGLASVVAAPAAVVKALTPGPLPLDYTVGPMLEPGYDVYKLQKAFGEFKEIVAANVLNRRDL